MLIFRESATTIIIAIPIPVAILINVPSQIIDLGNHFYSSNFGTVISVVYCFNQRCVIPSGVLFMCSCVCANPPNSL